MRVHLCCTVRLSCRWSTWCNIANRFQRHVQRKGWAFVPFGEVMQISFGGFASSVSFDPLNFDPGETALI